MHLQERHAAELSQCQHADLSGVWNWNVKQLYVYVTASYTSPSGTSNEVVIWDSIVSNSSNSQLNLKGVYNDYPLFDRGQDLRARPIALALHWDVMPITGYLYRDLRRGRRVRMPEQYCSGQDCALVPLDVLPLPSEGQQVNSAHSEDL